MTAAPAAAAAPPAPAPAAAGAPPGAPAGAPAGGDAGHVDRENPWPGLWPFTERGEYFFNGRDAETAELAHLVRREAITVLHGQSGMGKSSLLLAGLFPALRREEYLPVYIRLDHDAASPPFEEQVFRHLFAACDDDGVDYPANDEGLGLWAYLHRTDATFWSRRNRVLTPVLVIDQFEELFTIGSRARAQGLFDTLAELVDNRPPRALREQVARSSEVLQAYDLDRSAYRIVLGIREDYLSALTGLKRRMGLTLQSYFDLQAMDGRQALDAVLKTGSHLVDEPVAQEIVRSLARTTAEAGEEGAVPAAPAAPDDRAPPADDAEGMRVDPALLSMVCRELNNRRLRNGRPRITADLLAEESPETIIARFYQDSFEGLDPRVRVFVEEQLLTEKGFRSSAPRADITLRHPGVTGAAIEYLIGKRRLLRVEARLGAPRVELTHDVLTVPARESRDRRRLCEHEERAQTELAARRRQLEEAERQREAERSAQIARVRMRVGSAVLLSFAVLAMLAGWQAFKAQRAAGEASRQAALARVQKDSAEYEKARAESARAEADSLRLSAERDRRSAERDRDRATAAKARADSAAELLRVRQTALATTVASLQATQDSVRRAEQMAFVARAAADRYIKVSDDLLRQLQTEIRASRASARADLEAARSARNEAERLAGPNQLLVTAARHVLCAAAAEDASKSKTDAAGAAERTVRDRIVAELRRRTGAHTAPTRASRRPAAADTALLVLCPKAGA